MWSLNVYPDPSFWCTKFALHIDTIGWRNFVSLLEFSVNPISLFFLSTDFYKKSKVNASEGVLVRFIGSKGPLIIKKLHTEIF